NKHLRPSTYKNFEHTTSRAEIPKIVIKSEIVSDFLVKIVNKAIRIKYVVVVSDEINHMELSM
ncbi:hypothetical protein APC12_08150, partial [Acinetobacter baumannii]